MVRKKKKPGRTYFLSVKCSEEMRDKLRRMAESEHRSASMVLRRLVAEAPEPGEQQAEAS